MIKKLRDSWRKLNKQQKIIWLFSFSMIALLAVLIFRPDSNTVSDIPLSKAVELSKDGTFNKAEAAYSNTTLKGVMTLTLDKNAKYLDVEGKEVTLTKGDTVDIEIGSLSYKDLTDIGFVLPEEYSQSGSSVFDWSGLLMPGLMFIMFVGLMLLLNGGYLFGRFKRFKVDKNKVCFSDVGGMEEVKSSLSEAVSFLKDREHLSKLGATMPKGILLIGPPGVGKTLLARAIATEAGVQFIYCTGSEFHSMWVGVAGSRVKQLFRTARKQPTIVFIDEFDSVAQSRGLSHTDVGQEFDHTLNQLLTEMDGFNKDDRILVLAATNHPEGLDPAVLRPGRFDRKVNVTLPSYEERLKILMIHARNKPVFSTVSFGSIAKQTVGMSGADLAEVLNEAAIIAGQEHAESIDTHHINKAIDRVVVGRERGSILNEKERKIVAYHEAGHALVAACLPNADKVQKVSILPHGQAGGFTRVYPDTESIIMSQSKLTDTISVLLGGRAAERLVFGDVTTSAKDDLNRANQLAYEMVTHYGMGVNTGIRYVNGKEFSNVAKGYIDLDVKMILDCAHDKALDLLQSKREELSRVANRLLEVESISGEELQDLISKVEA